MAYTFVGDTGIFGKLKFFSRLVCRKSVNDEPKACKKICNALALSQDMTIENKAKISLSYHCSRSYGVKI